jgi:hypothetical protein
MRSIALLALAVVGCSAGSGSDAAPPRDLSAPPADLAGADLATADLAAADLAGADLATGSSDTWASFAAGFFASYCTSCHSPTGSDPNGGKDFTQYASVMANAPTIRCGVAVTQDPSWSCAAFPPPKQFPICNTGCTNAKPSDAERDRLVAWIGAGLPQ